MEETIMNEIKYMFRLCIEQDRDSILEAAVGASDTAGSVAKARETILKLLDEFTPEFASPTTRPNLSVQEDEPEVKPEPAMRNGVKGFILLRCQECGNVFKSFQREPKQRVFCKCGHCIGLTVPLARFQCTCAKCGKRSWGKTNIEDASIEVRCSCGNQMSLNWRSEDRQYGTFEENAGAKTEVETQAKAEIGTGTKTETEVKTETEARGEDESDDEETDQEPDPASK